MSETDIGWTGGPNGEPGYTCNPWSGCVERHLGCSHCYAKALPPSMRRGAAWGEVWAGGQRIMAPEKYLQQAFKWARDAAKAGQRRKVFCASTADVLEVPEDPPEALRRAKGDAAWNEAKARVDKVRVEMEAQRLRLWDIIRGTAVLHVDGTPYDDLALGADGLDGGVLGPLGLDWLLLTKRPEHWALVPEDVRPLVWLGTSISDQETADEYVPRLLEAKGFRYRFISAEPLVGPVDLSEWLERIDHCGACGAENTPQGLDKCPGCGAENHLASTWGVGQAERYRTGERYAGNGPDEDEDGPQIHWVIVGGESGRKARPFNVGWAHSIIQQCQEAGVACFVKQLGSNPAGLSTSSQCDDDGKCCALKDPKGGDWEEWPTDLRVRQWPDGTALPGGA